MTEELSTASAVRNAVIRRPTGAAARVRAASAFQGYEDAVRSTPLPPPSQMAYEAMRTTLHLLPTTRSSLKRRALELDTTMGDLIRAAISAGLQDPEALARASMAHRGESGGVRTTLDLPRAVHRTLKLLAADQDTSLQALIVTAVLQNCPDLD
ncbi:hypothetical protein [Mycobacterium paragordonae]|uniref:Uncharacterized protein n=1 Tax=Mycobacterium paragordonae TaxID=1389713 RepID=A0ABQ1C9G4_9MYCO|nr:hypothetical protein [Mycobacterium paragordonae]GFG80847.1 hypothetical protein MPRG_41230 [Mycobacterium paragordonae]